MHFVNASDRLKDVNVGGTRGVSMVDFDNDGWVDLALTGPSVQLYRNTGNGTFDEGRVVLVEEGQYHNYGMAWGDIDGDADLDLIVTGYEMGRHFALWRNDGGTNFTQITEAAGIQGDVGGRGAIFSDLDHDGDLDLYICRGAVFGPGNPQGGRSESEPQGGTDEGKNGHPNQVYRNDGKGNFEDVTEAWGLSGRPTGESFVAVPFDFDYDGFRDLYLVHDWGADQLFRNPGMSGPWEDVSSEYLGEAYTTIMGLAVADFSGDGRWDLYGTQIAEDRDVLYVQDEQNRFVNRYEATIAGGLDQSKDTKGWGVAFADLDNDGDLDVINAASFHDYSVDTDEEGYLTGRMVVLQHERSEATQQSLLVDVTSQSGEVLQRTVDGWGLAIGDVDNNGTLDVLVGVEGFEIPAGLVNDQTTPLLLINDSPSALANQHLSIRLSQPGTPNPFAVGAVVTVTVPDTTSTIGPIDNCPKPSDQPQCNPGEEWTDTTGDGCLNECVKATTCPGACNDYVEGAACQCDVGCFDSGDCCSDVCTLCESTLPPEANCDGLSNEPPPEPEKEETSDDDEVATVRSTSHMVLAGTSYVSQSSYALHFGLGTEDAATQVTVQWPDGTLQTWDNLPAGSHTLTRKADEAMP